MQDTAATAAAFLQSICADPEDDGLRMIFADFLDEQGDSTRAGFIRTQIALANWPCECDSEERVYHDKCRCNEKLTLQRRARELLRMDHGGGAMTNETAWLADLLLPIMGDGQSNDRRVFRWEWRRGFVDAITLSCRDWLAHGPALVACQPLRVVRLTDAGVERVVSHDPGWRVLMPNPEFWNPFHPFMGWHATEAEARWQLSEAMLWWARREA